MARRPRRGCPLTPVRSASSRVTYRHLGDGGASVVQREMSTPGSTPTRIRLRLAGSPQRWTVGQERVHGDAEADVGQVWRPDRGSVSNSHPPGVKPYRPEYRSAERPSECS